MTRRAERHCGNEKTPSMKYCLVVDDSDLIRTIALRLLKDLGLDTGEARSAGEAVVSCAQRPPDAVLLDWDLPAMGALDFLRGIAALAPESRPVIILCATENDPQQFTLARAAGAAHHVLKPFDRQTLGAVLTEAGLIEGGAARAGRQA